MGATDTRPNSCLVLLSQGRRPVAAKFAEGSLLQTGQPLPGTEALPQTAGYTRLVVIPAESEVATAPGLGFVPVAVNRRRGSVRLWRGGGRVLIRGRRGGGGHAGQLIINPPRE